MKNNIVNLFNRTFIDNTTMRVNRSGDGINDRELFDINEFDPNTNDYFDFMIGKSIYELYFKHNSTSSILSISINLREHTVIERILPISAIGVIDTSPFSVTSDSDSDTINVGDIEFIYHSINVTDTCTISNILNNSNMGKLLTVNLNGNDECHIDATNSGISVTGEHGHSSIVELLFSHKNNLLLTDNFTQNNILIRLINGKLTYELLQLQDVYDIILELYSDSTIVTLDNVKLLTITDDIIGTSFIISEYEKYLDRITHEFSKFSFIRLMLTYGKNHTMEDLLTNY